MYHCKRQIEKDLTTLSAEQLISTKSDQPIIFDILLKDNKLSPIITPLEFAEPLKKELLPELPEETKGKAFYNKKQSNKEQENSVNTSFHFIF